MSRTPPAPPYPRTISSPDCADPPVRPAAGKAHRPPAPHGAIERDTRESPSVASFPARSIPVTKLSHVASATSGAPYGSSPHYAVVVTSRGHFVRRGTWTYFSDSASAIPQLGHSYAAATSTSTTGLRTRQPMRGCTVGNAALSPAEVPCPPRARRDGKPRSTTVRSDPHDHFEHQVSALFRAMQPAQAPSLPQLRARVRHSSSAPHETSGSATRRFFTCPR